MIDVVQSEQVLHSSGSRVLPVPAARTWFIYSCGEGLPGCSDPCFLSVWDGLCVQSGSLSDVPQIERSSPLQDVRPPDWNLSLILRCFSQPPFEPLKLASDKHLTWKASFLLALVYLSIYLGHFPQFGG